MIRSSWRSRWDHFLVLASKISWALFLLALPVTSFPFFPPGIGGGTLVRPLAVYPLLALLLLVTLPRLLREPLPRTLLAFLPFVLVALAGVLLAALQGIEPAQGISVWARMLRALITLGLGGAIYFTVALVPRNSDDLSFTLRWLYIGFALALLWGSLQAIYVVAPGLLGTFSSAYFDLLNDLQKLVSIRRLFPTRISGPTYEPNWFAEQISFLLMPWLFAAVLSKRSVFNIRWGWLTIELLLLLWAGVILVFTYSRAGLFTLLVLVFLSLLFFRSRRQAPSAAEGSRARTLLRRSGLAALAVLALALVIFLAGTQNSYFSRLWRYWTEDTRTSSYLEYIAFGQRLIYWQAAYSIYAENPILGAGLGNFAFYFEDHLPERSFQTVPEILRVVTRSQGADRLITSKNLYARLLAETGLVGSAAFFTFTLAVFGCALVLWLSQNPEQKYWGAAGLLGFVMFALTAISTDSFSIPNMWVVFGLITAAAHIYLESNGKPQIYTDGTDNQPSP